ERAAGSAVSAQTESSSDSAPQPLLRPSDLQDLAKRIIALALNPPNAADMNANNNYVGEMNNLTQMVSTLQKLVPDQASALAEKMAGFKDSSDPGTKAWNDLQPVLQNGTVDAILDAAAKAPEPLRPQVYHYAALKAVGEGDLSRARQIVNDKVADPAQREELMKQLDRQSFEKARSDNKISEARALLARIKNPEERSSLLIELSEASLQKGDKKTALEIADEAYGLIPGRARSYNQIGIQLRLAHVYRELNTAKAVALLGPLVDQMNSLIAATAVLDGFDIQNAFHDSEMRVQYGTAIAGTLSQYAGALSGLAGVDFDTAKAIAATLERIEVRTFAQLVIARAILIGPQSTGLQYGFGGGFGRAMIIDLD